MRADPVVEPSYYRPLLGFLDRAGGPPFRVEIPFTQAHWEAAEVARRFPLARGWERQLDGTRDALFYGGVLNRVTYGTWLAEHGVGYVALPSGKPDYSARKERALIESGLPYLKLAWRSKDWRVYEVTLPHAILIPQGGCPDAAGHARQRVGSTIDVAAARRGGGEGPLVALLARGGRLRGARRPVDAGDRQAARAPADDDRLLP